LGLVVGVGREATMRREAISRIGVGAMTWRSTLVVGATTGAGAWRAIGRGDQAGCRSGGTHPASNRGGSWEAIRSRAVDANHSRDAAGT
jgi:hypothetical protein